MDSSLKFRGCRAEMFGRNRKRMALGLFCLIMSIIIINSIINGSYSLRSARDTIGLVALVIGAPFFLITGGGALVFPKKCPSYKYALEQLGADLQSYRYDRDVFYEIDEDIRKSGVRHAKIILSDNWIWIDQDTMVLKRDNLKSFHIEIDSTDRGKQLIWVVKMQDKNGKDIRAAHFHNGEEPRVRKLYDALLEAFPDIPNKIVKPTEYWSKEDIERVEKWVQKLEDLRAEGEEQKQEGEQHQ